ncbi:MAG: zinc-binding dehydrogenase [Chloroflexi bacterium]|nr:MAG: zinc-binding dehydrogenase [Chloroflexota bacterium]
MAVETVAEPRQVDDEVLVRPEAAGICGSEIEGYLGRMPNRIPPLVMGHEFAGTVVTAGRDARDEWSGRRVAVNPLLSCRVCVRCKAGERNLCAERRLIGVHVAGGFAERVSVPAANLVLLPDAVDARIGALVEPLANAVHAVGLALRLGAVQTAIVLGAGTIGLFALHAGRAAGIPDVRVIEPHPARRTAALAAGARAAHADAGELARGGRADLVIDAVGATATRRAALDVVRVGGVVVLLGLHEDESALPFHRIVRDQITLQGSFAYTDANFAAALELLRSGKVSLGELAGTRPLEAGPEAFATLAAGPTAQLKTFLSPLSS